MRQIVSRVDLHLSKKSFGKVFLLIALFSVKSLSINAQTVLPPTQTDEIIIDNGTTGKADGGDRIRYKVTIINTGTSNATGVQFNAIPDPRTTLLAGSFKSSPLAVPDVYASTGNVGIIVPVANGLLLNDFDDNIPGLTITAGTFATTQGGSIMINADGSFMYTPPPGFTGSDTYTYTLNDANGVGGGVPATDPGVITFTVSNLIWFIDNSSVAATSDGRLSSPFKSLTDFNGGSGTAGNVVYIENTGSNYTGGIVLQNNEILIGEGHTGGANLSNVLPFSLAPNSKPVPNINGTRPIITNATGDGIQIASGNSIRGLDVGNSLDFAIDDNGSAGTLTILEVAINNMTGGGLRVDNGGILSVTLGSLASGGGVSGLHLANTSGAFTVTGITTIDGTHSSDLIHLNTISTTVTLTGNTQLFASGANQAIEMQNVTGVISIPFATSNIFGSTGVAVLIHQGNSNFTYSGRFTTNMGGTIKVTGRTGGTIDFQGRIDHNGATTPITVGTALAGENNSGGIVEFSGNPKILSSQTATAVSLIANTGTTINFTNGGLQIAPSSGNGLHAINGGTLNITGTGNFINGPNPMVALNIDGVNAGTNGITFQNVAAGVGTISIISSSGTKTLGRVTSNAISGQLLTLTNAAIVNIGDASNVSTLSSSSGMGLVINNTTLNLTGLGLDITASQNIALNVTGGIVDINGGGIDVVTSTGTGMSITGGATLNLAGPGNTIAGGPGSTGISINSGNAGASGINLISVLITNGAVGSIISSTGIKNLGRISGNSGNTNNLTLQNAGTINIGDATNVGVLNTGNGDGLTINGTTLNLSGLGLDITSTGSGRGVNMTGGTVSITGGLLDIITNTGVGLNATSGTISLTGGNNTINSTSATALNITSTTIAAGNMNFRSVSSGNNTAATDPVNGIVLSTTGATGGLIITGTGTTNASGGTIQSISARGVSASNTINLSLKNMAFTNANLSDAGTCGAADNSGCNAAIYLNTVTNAILDNIDISGTTTQQGINVKEVNGFKLLNSTILNAGAGGGEEGGVYALNLFGTVEITNTSITFPAGRGVTIYNISKTLALDVTNSNFDDTQTSAVGADGFEVSAFGTSNTTIDILNSLFRRNKTNGLQVITEDNAITSLDIQGCTFDYGNFAGGGGGIDIDAADNGDVDFNIISNPLFKGALTSVVNFFAQQASTMEGRFNSNTVQVVTGSGTAIRAVAQESSNMKIEINGNTVTGVPLDNGIDVISRAGTGRMDAIISNNIVSVLAGANAEIRVAAGASGSAFSNKTCAYVHHNTVTNNGFSTWEGRVVNAHELILQGAGASMAAVWNGNTNLPVSPPSIMNPLISGAGLITFGGTCNVPMNPLISF